MTISSEKVRKPILRRKSCPEGGEKQNNLLREIFRTA
jgi:hypothetical protein